MMRPRHNDCVYECSIRQPDPNSACQHIIVKLAFGLSAAETVLDIAEEHKAFGEKGKAVYCPCAPLQNEPLFGPGSSPRKVLPWQMS